MSDSVNSGGSWATWPRNVRLFLVFRVFFNARYYYPIFALLFLDLGLTLSQFAVLNALWAVVIVGLEVPSGALADLWGRRRLLRMAAILMVIEMVALLVPQAVPALLLPAMALNRICSGAAEALASGADEALAYDSLEESQRGQWSRILEVQMRYLNGAMMIAMLVGSAVYDPSLWGHFLSAPLSHRVALAAPIVLTLMHAAIVVVAVFRMEEEPPLRAEAGKEAIRAAFGQTRDTVRWLLKHRAAKMVILATVLFDHLTRQGLVVSSDYLTAISIPKAYLGVLGAAAGLAGSLSAAPLAALARRVRPSSMYWVLYVSLMIVSVGLAHPVKYFSAIWITALSVIAGAIGYLTSLYLNQLADPKRRATLLSVKGLAINLGYGWISLAYGGWVARLPKEHTVAPVVSAFGVYLPYGTVLALVLAALAMGKSDVAGNPGGYGDDPTEAQAEETPPPTA